MTDAGSSEHVQPTHAKRIILLVGPKGSGKSHIGVELARQFEARFLRIEAIWQALHLERGDFLSEAYIDEGMARTLAHVEAAIHQSEAPVILESTGGFDRFTQLHDSLRRMGTMVLVKVEADLDECRRRIVTRDASLQVPVSDELVARINQSAAQVDLAWDLVLRNHPPLSPEDLGRAFASILPRRRTPLQAT